MEKNKKYSMIWYEIFYCIKLPISIALSVITYMIASSSLEYTSNFAHLIIWFIILLTAIIYTILLYKMYYREKDTYFYFIVCLFIDILFYYMYFGYINNITVNILITLFWFIINIIYIRKRKYVFTEDK